MSSARSLLLFCSPETEAARFHFVRLLVSLNSEWTLNYPFPQIPYLGLRSMFGHPSMFRSQQRRQQHSQRQGQAWQHSIRPRKRMAATCPLRLLICCNIKRQLGGERYGSLVDVKIQYFWFWSLRHVANWINDNICRPHWDLCPLKNWFILIPQRHQIPG